MKFILGLLLALNFAVTFPASGGPGGSTTPFPFGMSPDDLVGTWINTPYKATIVIQHAKSTDGKAERLFVTMNGGQITSQGYLFFTGEAFCGVLFNADGRNIPMCLKGRYGLLSVESKMSRMYFTYQKKISKR